MEKAPDESCLFVMFGATGDLMRRKLLPALFQLAEDGLLPARYQILGVAREPGMDDARFRRWVRQALADAGLAHGKGPRRWCEDCLHFDTVGDGGAADYQALAARIALIEATHALSGNRLLYMALPPQAFPGTIAALARAGLAHSQGWTRLVIEKPFGHDLASARRLNALVHRHFGEAQVYRIDHYLGKETVQNLLAFRFGNALFESAWNREHIKSVQITVAEALGIGHRAAYYERAGALRDIVQNHITQLLTLTAMEVPAAFDAESIRHEKVKVLRSVLPIGRDAVVFGQYAAQRIPSEDAARHIPPGDAAPPILSDSAARPIPSGNAPCTADTARRSNADETAPPRRSRSKSGAADAAPAARLLAYREEPGVAADSTAETYVALRLSIENWRWQGVPFYLRTGKRLARRMTQIVIEFRGPPVALFRGIDCSPPHTNRLAINLQPDEGFTLSFEVKSPGNSYALQTRHMQFRYAEAFGASLSAGYETLLLDVLEGDQTLFVHADETEASWRLFTPLLRRHAVREPYAAGSWGPAAADRLIAVAGGAWNNEP
ncbi:MAG: glucose-6-phosphate dehydrogenase [Candidatus Accumulibacter sp.]|nr:glucose-6-phosphate dehydrogenase [Accumulibacter sp.]